MLVRLVPPDLQSLCISNKMSYASKASGLHCGLNCAFQAVCESQSQAAGREYPQPSPVVQAGTGPPRARGGAGQDDPLSQTGPRYSVLTTQTNSFHLVATSGHLSLWLLTRDHKLWHTSHTKCLHVEQGFCSNFWSMCLCTQLNPCDTKFMGFKGQLRTGGSLLWIGRTPVYTYLQRTDKIGITDLLLRW